VIGFIQTVFFDNDIGKEPPLPPGIRTMLATNDPATCDYEFGTPEYPGGRSPWQFGGTTGTPQPCNMVRGRVGCETLLLGSHQFAGTRQNRNVSLVH